jgi:hypothetical protein
MIYNIFGSNRAMSGMENTKKNFPPCGGKSGSLTIFILARDGGWGGE